MRVRTAALSLVLLLPCAIVMSCAKKKRPTPVVNVALPQVASPETGLASWYGHPYHGRPSASGEIYDMETLTAAHRTLPFGTLVRVTNLANEKTVEVRINDRGPFVDGRVIDLSHAAARTIDLIGPGVARVRLDVISFPAVSPSDNLFAVQAGAFRDRSRADQLRATMQQEYGSARLILKDGAPPLWRVLVGRESSQDRANLLAQRVRSELGDAFVVRLDLPAGGN